MQKHAKILERNRNHARNLAFFCIAVTLFALGCGNSGERAEKDGAAGQVPKRALQPLGLSERSGVTAAGQGSAVTGSESAGSDSLVVTGEVSQEHYTSLVSDPLSVPYAYHVTVNVKNAGTAPIVYDAIEAQFIPANGKPLGMTQRSVAAGTDSVEKTGATEPSLDEELPPNDSKSFDFSTNGYTLELLHNAGDAPLRFAVAFVKNNHAVSDVFVADLPALDELPFYETLEIEKEKAKPLAFTRASPSASLQGAAGVNSLDGDTAVPAPPGFEWQSLDEIHQVALKPQGWHSWAPQERKLGELGRRNLYVFSENKDEDSPRIAVSALELESERSELMKPSILADGLSTARQETREWSGSTDQVLSTYTLTYRSANARGVRRRTERGIIYESLYIPVDETNTLFMVEVAGDEEVWESVWAKGEIVAQQFFGTVIDSIK